MIDYAMIPPAVMRAMKGHVEGGIPPGGFVQSVLENNLVQAIGSADEHSYAALKSIVGWVWNEAPASCWGSPEKVRAWRERFASKKESTQAPC